jgi:hypothetical protein
MAKTKGQIGAGSTIGYSTSLGGTYVTIAEVGKITPPDMTADDVKMSNLDSPLEAHEYAAGFTESGEAKIDLNFYKTEAAKCYAQFKIDQFWKITYRDGSTLIWNGYMKMVGGEIPYGDRMSVSAAIKVSSGLPTFTAAA